MPETLLDAASMNRSATPVPRRRSHKRSCMIPTRAAIRVSQDQSTVAKPCLSALTARDQLYALALRNGDQCARDRQQRIVSGSESEKCSSREKRSRSGRSAVVTREVSATRVQSSASSPTVEPGDRAPSRSRGARDPGRRPRARTCRAGSSGAGLAAEVTLLMRDQAGKADRVDSVAADKLCGRLRGPGPSAWPRCASRRSRRVACARQPPRKAHHQTAPSAKFGA